MFRPFQIGDFVTIAGNNVTVKAVTSFFTLGCTPTNIQIAIPNQIAMQVRCLSSSLLDS